MTVVELTGCTGAGKTLLCRAVRERLRAAGRRGVVVADCLRWGRVGEGWLPAGVRNLVQEIELRPLTRSAFHAHPGYHEFLGGAVRRYADSGYFAWRALRGARRQIGGRELLVQADEASAIGLMDEGTVHTAYYVLVQLSRPPEPGDVRAFARLVPRPDLIVHVTAPREVLLRRFATRTHPRRRGLAAAEVARLVDHGRELCTALLQTPELAPRVVEVTTGADVEGAAATVLERIHAIGSTP